MAEYFGVHLSTAQSVSNNQAALLAFDTVDADTAYGWSADTHTYVVPVTGLWLFVAHVAWAPNPNGLRLVAIETPSNSPAAQTLSDATFNNGGIAHPRLGMFTAGTPVDVRVNQTSGAALDTGVRAGAMFWGVQLA